MRAPSPDHRDDGLTALQASRSPSQLKFSLSNGTSRQSSRDPTPSPSPTGLSFPPSQLRIAQAGLGLGLLSVPSASSLDLRESLEDNTPAQTTAEEAAARAKTFEKEVRGGKENRPRRKSFFGAGSSASTAPVSKDSLPAQQRKTSGPRAFIRKAKSFGTSPILSSVAAFGSSPSPQNSSSATTAETELRRAEVEYHSTSVPASSSIASHPWPKEEAILNAPSSNGSTSPRLRSLVSDTRLESPPPLTSSPVPSPTLAKFAESSVSPADGEDMVLPEPVPSPHWLFAPVITPQPSPSRKSLEKAKAKEVAEHAREESRERKSSMLSRKTGRFSLFRKSETPVPAANPVPPPGPLQVPQSNGTAAQSLSQDAIDASHPGPSTVTNVQSVPISDAAPTLPSLMFSSSRMSWAWGNTSSPVSSPAKLASRPSSSAGSPTKEGSSSASPNRPSLPRSQSSSTVISSRSVERSNSRQMHRTDSSDDARQPNASQSPSTRRRGTVGEGSKGMFGAVSGFFSGGSSNALGASMSRSSSSNSLSNPNASAMPQANEFGALFDNKPRKRGLSVGNTVLGGTSDTRKRAGSSSSLSNSWIPPASGNLLSVPDAEGSLPVPTMPSARARSSTEPKRFSLSSNVSGISHSLPFVSSKAAQSSYMPSPPASPTLTRQSSFAGYSGDGSGGSRKASLSIERGVDGRPKRPRATSMASFTIEENESPDAFVRRLSNTVSKSDISRILASGTTPFLTAALTCYLSSFDFDEDPLDIALRKFLMGASLPPETQQIDRVMEAFAKRYTECNPGLFTSSDTPYVLAFSLVMLSTDQFNPSNKSKMTKADYVKNARIDGVPNELLEYFFDQITITPFVFVEEDDNRPELMLQAGSAGITTSSSSFFSKANSSSKIDPYHLISTGQTRAMRVDIESRIPAKSPFSFTGTTAFFNATTLHQSFACAPILQINPSRPRAKTSVGPPTSMADGGPLVPVASNTTYVTPQPKEKNTASSLKITKIGLLARKEDLAEGGKKAASRKWKGWSVILTGSQLLFFKDANVATSLQESVDAAVAAHAPPDENHILMFSIATPFKPDAVLSLAQSAAIYDSTYSKYKNVFRLVAPAGRQYLFQAKDKDDLNSWLAHINYAASFKTANLRIRGPAPKKGSVPNSPHMTSVSSPPHSPAHAGSVASAVSAHISSPPSPAVSGAVNTSHESSRTSRDSSLPDSLLAAIDPDAQGDKTPLPRPVNGSTSQDYGFPLMKTDQQSPSSEHPSFDREPITRAEILRAKISELEASIASAKAMLQADLRLARNLAVLTPFRQSTRERILLGLRPVEERVRRGRMLLCKLVCHREVLARDLLVEDRESSLLRKVSQHSRHGSLSRKSSTNARPGSPLRSTRGRNVSTASRPTLLVSEPTTNFEEARQSLESDHEEADDDDDEDGYATAAMGFSLTDDELDRLRSPPLLQRSQTETGPGRLRAASSATMDDELPASRPPVVTTRATSGTSDQDGKDAKNGPTEHRKGSTEEASRPASVIEPTEEDLDQEAEDWRHTRAGKRVSLINYGKLDETSVSTLMRIREERRSEMGV